MSDAGSKAAIEDDIAALVGPPRTTELPSEKARRVRNAISAGDFATAERITRDVIAVSRIENWRYHPFDDFIDHVSNVVDDHFEARLNEWVAQSGSDAIPLLLRARYYYDKGWFTRGHRFSRDTRPSDMASFVSLMQKALADADSAARVDYGNPYGFYLKLLIVRGSGDQRLITPAFEQVVTRFPGYYPAYDLALSTLKPRWGGSIAQMYRFVDRYAGEAGRDSPMQLLYLSLYRDILSAASSACTKFRNAPDVMQQCVRVVMQKNVSADLESRVQAALKLYDLTDRYQFGLALKPILVDLLRTTGGDAYSGAILQIAATGMHSDAQLVEDTPGNNNYIIDEAVGRSWYQKGFYDNALKKYQEALKDIEKFRFPSEAEKDLAISKIYVDMLEPYEWLHQYGKAIAYAQAAVTRGDQALSGHHVCYGYHQLKDNKAAVASCTRAISDEPNNIFAYFWRGLAYRDLGNADAELNDLTVVADSDNEFRANAAIEMSMVYFNRKDNKGALAVLNRYPYLYNTNVSRKSDVAVSYNNRCYAYMQLGQLQKALDDCTQSLRYGSIPDAYKKQEELVRRLGKAAL